MTKGGSRHRALFFLRKKKSGDGRLLIVIQGSGCPALIWYKCHFLGPLMSNNGSIMPCAAQFEEEAGWP